ncbi:MAG: acyl-CoA thioesterase [Vicinamibacteria bacterium]|jgi:4-hydroxybenzoyl-CoA thioesterase|nr:acyl-CoA thioesterase [Vicinamibacteria bacterium]
MPKSPVTRTTAPFTYRIPVMFHDVDAAGTAYYPRLVDFCHRAFESFFNDRIGNSYAKVIGGGVGFPTVRFEIDFISPIRHGDTIDISVRVADIGRTSVGLAYEARRGRTVLFRASNVVVVVDLRTMTKKPLQGAMRRRFVAAAA